MKPPVLGILMLETRFSRPLGDAGNPASWDVSCLTQVVPGAFPARVVQSAASLRAAGVLPACIEAVRDLQGQGATAITTSCGFLVLFQDELQSVARVPVVTSSLLQLPALLQEEESVGVLTISAASLCEEHLLAARVPADRLANVEVGGVDPAGEFAGAILGNRAGMDLERCAADVVAAAVALKKRAPRLQTLVLECTNMPPYAGLIQRATGLRVRSLKDSPVLGAALRPRL